MSANDKKISQLAGTATYVVPASLFVPVYNTVTGATEKYRLDNLGSPLVAGNNVRGGVKIVRYLSSGFYNVPATASTLDRLDPETLAVGTTATVINPADAPTVYTLPPAQYILGPVAPSYPGAFEAYADAAPGTTVKVWVAWAAAPNPTAAGIWLLEDFNPDKVEYKPTTTVKYLTGGTVQAFTANQRILKADYPDNKIPAPDNPLGQLLWQRVLNSPYEHPQNTDTGTTSPVFTIALDSQNQSQGEQRTLLGFGTSQGGPVAMFAYRWQNGDDSPATIFEACYEYDATPGAPNVWEEVGGDSISLSNAAPVANGAASAGASNEASRADHVHPTDASRAPVNNPNLTGSATAPTPAGNSNNTLIATTAWVVAAVSTQVNAAIAALTGSAPAALDTIYELAAALTDASSGLQALLSNVAGRLSIASNLADLASPSAARGNLGLGNVNNTTDLNKPISTATQTALNDKAGLPLLAANPVTAANPITFDRDRDYENQTTATATAFTNAGSPNAFSFVGAVRGATAYLEYTPTAAITFPAGFVILSGNSLALNVKNYVFFRYVRAGLVVVTIA